jgi:hypothetical protein
MNKLYVVGNIYWEFDAQATFAYAFSYKEAKQKLLEIQEHCMYYRQNRIAIYEVEMETKYYNSGGQADPLLSRWFEVDAEGDRISPNKNAHD